MHHKAGEPTESHGCSQRLSAEKYRHLSLATEAEAGNGLHVSLGRSVPRVLIVDDEPDIQKMLDTFLSMQGYSIETVSNGEAALCRLQDQPFDLVLTEYSMPGMNGLELLDRIKSLDETIEVILLTGYGTVEYAVTAFKEGGAFDFIQKPLNDVNLLLVSVERALERRDLRRKNDRMLVELKKLSAAMDEKVLARVFEPFFTSKFIGSGVGMAVVYGIVKGYNGKVEIDSEVGKGTRVRIILPAA